MQVLKAIILINISFFIDWKARALFSRDIFPQRIVHLDMKAAPPTVKYLEVILTKASLTNQSLYFLYLLLLEPQVF